MRDRVRKNLATVIALCAALAFTALPATTEQAFAFGHGGNFGGGSHFGGGHFGGGHFGGGHFGGGHFGGQRFGGFAHHFGGHHFGGHHFAGHHFTGHHYAHVHSGRHFAHGSIRNGHAAHNTSTANVAAIHHNANVARVNHFQDIHGFNANGFNRNAFGGTRGWNQWGRNNWGAGWNNWGSGWGYWAGPVFWPFLYGDALSFALWPYDLYDPFFAYGPDYLFTSIFWPGPLYGGSDYYGGYGAYPLFDVYGYPPGATNYYSYYHRRHHHRRVATSDHAATAAESCSGLAPGVTDLPIARMKKAIKPTDQQILLLDKLQEASDKANSILRASCPSQGPLTPTGRLDGIATRLHAMIEAVNTIHDPLAAFDTSLDDSQKAELEKLGGRGNQRASKSSTQDLAALCKKQTAGFTLLPVERIEDVVKPTADQTSSFDALKSASTEAAQGLESSCPAQMPETVAGRLDALHKRLDALNDAVAKIKPALTDFYGKLSDEQKARFNVIGTASASNAQQSKSGD